MYKSFFYPLTKNKTLEVEIDSTNTYSWFDFSFVLNRKTDHAGLYVTLSLFKWELIIQIYDNRHWNYDENRWYLEGEEYSKWLDELRDLEKQFKNNNLEIYKGDLNIDFYDIPFRIEAELYYDEKNPFVTGLIKTL